MIWSSEPKIKYYIELKTTPGKDESDLPELQGLLDGLEHAVAEGLLEATRNGLDRKH